jgi:uncharacterized protein involved in exopolysaccharide biosynthesis
MSTQSAWSTLPHDPLPGRAMAGSGWASRPRYAPSDFITLLWGERWLMLVIFLVIFGVGAAFALTLKKSYPASASILVQLGQEYVYEPRAGDAARGAVPENDSLVQSEVEILISAQLRERTIRRIGLEVLYPTLGEKYAAAPPAGKAQVMAKAVEDFGKNLTVGSAPDNPVVRIGFEHESGEMAARAVNTLLEEYLIYRRTVLIQPTSPVLERQDGAARLIASETNDNIRIVDRAVAPTRGESLRKPVFALAFLFGAFSALCAGLIRVFLRPGLPTPASASRTLDMPVLGVAAYKGR